MLHTYNNIKVQVSNDAIQIGGRFCAKDIFDTSTSTGYATSPEAKPDLILGLDSKSIHTENNLKKSCISAPIVIDTWASSPRVHVSSSHNNLVLVSIGTVSKNVRGGN